MPDLLLDCYSDAALQRHLMRAPRLDQNGGLRHYAVDSNIVASFIDPDANATGRTEQSIGLGEIFHFDSTAKQQSIARRLMTSIMDGLSPGTPFILLSPIDAEVKSLFRDYIARAIGGSDVLADEAKKLHLELTQRLPVANLTISKDLIERALRLDSHENVTRLDALVKQRRLLRDDRITAETHSPALAESLAAARTIPEMVEFSALKIAWERRLSATGRPSSRRAENDAIALAKLELANRRLIQMETGETLFYLTQDTSILRATEDVRIRRGDEEVTFARAFVRHPRAFLDTVGALDALGEERGRAKTISDWLTVLLGRFENFIENQKISSGKIDLPPAMVARIRDVAEIDKNAAQAIKDSWSEFVSSAADEPSNFIARLKRIVESESSEEIETLLLEMKSSEDSAWMAVLDASVSTRFAIEIEVSSGEEIISREAPALIFNGRPDLSHFIEIARSWLRTPASFDLEYYRKQRDLVRDEDESLYGYFVSHAYLLAQQNQWKTAAVLARIAIDRAPAEFPRLPFESNGREAAYLLAHCLRLAAVRPHDLYGARLACEKAIALTKEEGRNATGFFDPVPERFTTERHAIDVAALEFAFAADSSDPGAFAAPAYQLGHKLAEIARHSTTRRSDMQANSDAALALDHVIERCCRASLSLALQFGSLGDDGALSRRTDLIEMLQKETDHPGPTAEISDVVLWLCRIARSSLSAADRKKLQNFKLKHETFPFDRVRFRTMVQNIRRFHGI